MQEQGKRLLLAVALIMGVLWVWQTIFKPKDADQDQQQTQQQKQQQQQAQLAAQGPQQSTVGSGSAAAPAGPEEKIVLTFPDVVVTFSDRGGTLSSWKLTDKRYEHDITKGELLPDPTKFPDSGSLAVDFDRGSTFTLAGAVWHGEKTSDRQVVYKASTDHLDVTKTFDVVPDAYMVKLTVAVAAKDDAHQKLALSLYEFQDPKQASTGSSRIAPRQWDSGTLRADGDNMQTPITSILEGGARFEPQIRWTGFEHPYLLYAFAPAPASGVVAKHTYAAPSGIMRTDIIFGDAPLGKGVAPQQATLVGYLGPKNLDQLEHADAVAGFKTGFDSVIDLGWFSIIGRPLLWLLLKFHSILGNWGIAIVLLTILVKLATLYWTTKSMRSMKAMAVLGPQMKQLQEKYKDDKQRLQMETMALYKTHGVNPLAGCLPILLQMPIWIALYRMLSNAGELYQQPFIGGWIDDLTASDPYYVLPVVLVVTMFAQARLTPTTVDPSQKLQQRMMQYGMPLMFGVMSFFFPAGLTLYIFTNTCLSAVHSIYMNKYDKKSLELAAKAKKAKEAAEAAKNAPKVDPKADKAEKAEKKDEGAPRARQGQRRKKGGRR
jgi:YidC/Oxa1 family membrane protein insertase